MKPLFVFLLILLSACTSKATTQQMEKIEAETLVAGLSTNAEQLVSLAVLQHPDTEFRIDTNGYPAWTWRGKNDLGACVHLDPKTKRPYLETQFPKGERYSSPKYIDLGTDGVDWMCRIHRVGFGINHERNWSNAECDQEGRVLLVRLQQALGQPSK